MSISPRLIVVLLSLALSVSAFGNTNNGRHSVAGSVIGGIVVAAVAGSILLCLCCMCMRRRRRGQTMLPGPGGFMGGRGGGGFFGNGGGGFFGNGGVNNGYAGNDGYAGNNAYGGPQQGGMDNSAAPAQQPMSSPAPPPYQGKETYPGQAVDNGAPQPGGFAPQPGGFAPPPGPPPAAHFR